MKSLSNSEDIVVDTANIRSVVMDTFVANQGNVQNVSIQKLLPRSGNDISVQANLIPTVNNTYSLGDTTQWNTVNSVRVYIPANDAGSTFNSPTTISVSGGNVLNNINLTINSPTYDYPGDNRSLMIPQRGFYIMTFMIEFDVTVSVESLKIELFNETVNEVQQTYTLYSNAFPSTTITFAFWGNSITDRFSLRARFSAAFVLSNFKVSFGRIMLASAYS